MKINIVIPAIGNSGGIDVIKKYGDLLSENGHDVFFYSCILAPNMHRYKSEIINFAHQAYCTIKGIIACVKKNRNCKYVLTLTNNRIRNADVVIATSWPTSYLINRLDGCKGRKIYFVQGFEIWDNYQRGLSSYLLPLDKIVVSTWINNKLRATLGIGPFPVVYSGIDKSIFYDKNVRKENGLQFLMLNHTLSIKGVKEGLEVFRRIRERFPLARLSMFGTCDRGNLPEFVDYVFCPTKEKLADLYCESNYFLFPSLEEGWGLTPIEAMACGCIVFGTRTGFVLDLGRDGKNMMISEPGNVDEMVTNIVEVIENHLECSIRNEAQKTIEELDWNISYERLVSLLC